jgi:hypothetical protein
MRKRRRTVVVGLLALAAVGVAWWTLTYYLTATERLLLGTWANNQNSSDGHPRSKFGPNHRYSFEMPDAFGTMKMVEWSGRWFVRDGAIVLDGEANDIRRAIRPILRFVGQPQNDPIRFRIISITSDELVTAKPDGTLMTLTRVAP